MRTPSKGLLIAGALGVGSFWLVRSRTTPGADRAERFDVTDEAVIEARPEVVYQAVVDEHDGKTSC